MDKYTLLHSHSKLFSLDNKLLQSAISHIHVTETETLPEALGLIITQFNLSVNNIPVGSTYFLPKITRKANLRKSDLCRMDTKKAMAGIVGRVLQTVHEDSQLSKDKQLHRMMQLLVLRTMDET